MKRLVAVVAVAERFATRVLRIGLGIGVGGIAIWLFSIAVEILGKPFASLSPLALIGGVLIGLLGIVVIVAAFYVALGPKGHSRIEASWRESQADEVRRRLGYDT